MQGNHVKIECCVVSCSDRFTGPLVVAVKRGWRKFKKADMIKPLGSMPRWWEYIAFCPACAKRYGVEGD